MMRKGCLLLVLALGGSGCLSSGSHVEAEKRQAPPVRMAEAPPPPPVTGDQVTEANAPQIAQALYQEMERESPTRTVAPTMAMNPGTMTP
jgi:hypothetical protein